VKQHSALLFECRFAKSFGEQRIQRVSEEAGSNGTPTWYARDRPKHGGATVGAGKTRVREWNGV
jgi:hypothetical protein